MQMMDYLPLRDVVFKTLRQAILTGELKPADRLMEIHLAEQLGVSRTPIREAIRKLELEGLVTVIPRRGAEVAKITEKNLRDVLEVRRNLDGFAVELACERITPEMEEELRIAVEAFEMAVKRADAKEIVGADVLIHDIIVEAAGNERLTQLVSNLSEQVYRYRYEYIKDQSTHGELVMEHRKIYESICKHDAKAAMEIMRTHILNQENGILGQLETNKEEKE